MYILLMHFIIPSSGQNCPPATLHQQYVYIRLTKVRVDGSGGRKIVSLRLQFWNMAY